MTIQPTHLIRRKKPFNQNPSILYYTSVSPYIFTSTVTVINHFYFKQFFPLLFVSTNLEIYAFYIQHFSLNIIFSFGKWSLFYCNCQRNWIENGQMFRHVSTLCANLEIFNCNLLPLQSVGCISKLWYSNMR